MQWTSRAIREYLSATLQLVTTLSDRVVMLKDKAIAISDILASWTASSVMVTHVPRGGADGAPLVVEVVGDGGANKAMRDLVMLGSLQEPPSPMASLAEDAEVKLTPSSPVHRGKGRDTRSPSFMRSPTGRAMDIIGSRLSQPRPPYSTRAGGLTVRASYRKSLSTASIGPPNAAPPVQTPGSATPKATLIDFKKTEEHLVSLRRKVANDSILLGKLLDEIGTISGLVSASAQGYGGGESKGTPGETGPEGQRGGVVWDAHARRIAWRGFLRHMNARVVQCVADLICNGVIDMLDASWPGFMEFLLKEVNQAGEGEAPGKGASKRPPKIRAHPLSLLKVLPLDDSPFHAMLGETGVRIAPVQLSDLCPVVFTRLELAPVPMFLPHIEIIGLTVSVPTVMSWFGLAPDPTGVRWPADVLRDPSPVHGVGGGGDAGLRMRSEEEEGRESDTQRLRRLHNSDTPVVQHVSKLLQLLFAIGDGSPNLFQHKPDTSAQVLSVASNRALALLRRQVMLAMGKSTAAAERYRASAFEDFAFLWETSRETFIANFVASSGYVIVSTRMSSAVGIGWAGTPGSEGLAVQSRLDALVWEEVEALVPLEQFETPDAASVYDGTTPQTFRCEVVTATEVSLKLPVLKVGLGC